MNVEGGMDGPGFLDPIPEDVSVVATSQHAANLSTVSAVASSDSGAMNAPTASKKRKGRRKHNNDPSGMLGTTAEMEDTLSDANASLGGANENSQEIPFAMPPKSDDPKAAFWSPTCKKWSLIVTILAAMVGIGMFVILYRLPQASANAQASLTQIPTEAPNFSPFTVSYDASAPPAYSVEEVMALDNLFLQVPGTNVMNMVDLSTPEGRGRDWMINSDTAMDVTDEQRVQQRYTMCVVFFATNGEFWTQNTRWLDPNQSECDWYGVSCNRPNNLIRSINLGDNNATGTIPDEITTLSNLSILNISHSKISGTIPQDMFNSLDRLDILDMSNNQLSGTVPERRTLTVNPGLRYIDVGLNQLTGTFPVFRKIESVNFEKNNLTSFDEGYAFRVRSLRKFKGFHNELAGPLPTIWNLPNLIELDLGYNFLTGTIPNDLWNLPSLKTLWLDHCNLAGPLPKSSEGTAMHRLWLDSNSLTGTIPVMFGWNWTRLYSVKLQENLLTGSISMEQCDRWKRLGPNDISMGPSDVSKVDASLPSQINQDRRSTWTFDVDCKIDCACCTNTDCA